MCFFKIKKKNHNTKIMELQKFLNFEKTQINFEKVIYFYKMLNNYLKYIAQRFKLHFWYLKLDLCCV